MKTKKHKVIFIADEMIEEQDNTRGFVSHCFARPHNINPMQEKSQIDYRFFSLQCGKPHSNVIDEIRSLIRGASCVMFDYGGFSFPSHGNHRLIDFYTREFVKLIKDNPSIEWWCVSNLPSNCFSDEEKEEVKACGCKFYWDE